MREILTIEGLEEKNLFGIGKFGCGLVIYVYTCWIASFNSD